MHEKTAGELSEGETFREVGGGQIHQIRKLGYHGDAVLVTTVAGLELVLDSSLMVEVGESTEQPDERLVPDFVLDTVGEYAGNAYPESVALRVGITVLDTKEDYGLTVETTGGDVVGSMTLSRDDADGIMSMSHIDHDLTGYEDDWSIPQGMLRTLVWVLPTNIDYEVVLSAGQIEEVADWLDYATGTRTWDWAEQGEEWTV